MTTWNRDDSDLSTSTGISSTTIGTVRITGNTIGLTSDTDLLSLADNTLTINGNISGTLTTSSQNNITSLGTLSSLSTSGDITIGSDADGTDRKIIFGHSTSKIIMGIDDSQDCFAINIGSDFETSNTIELTASLFNLGTSFLSTGNITALGDLTTTGDIYLADSKKIYIGNSSDNDYIKASGNSIDFYTNNSNRFSILDNQIQHFVPSVYTDAGAILKDASNHTRLSFTDSGSTVLYDESGNTTLTLDTDQNITLAGDLTISGGNITNAITFDNGITNAGTISAGTWNGTAIADGYISSASTWNAKQNALTFGISNTNAVKIDAADVADDDYARFTANGLEGRTLAEIKSDIGTGNSALVPAAGSSGQFLKHNGTFGNLPPNDFDVDSDSGSVNIEPGETLTIAGGTGITTAISGDTLTITNGVTNTNQLTTFTLGADGGTPQTIAHGNTLTIEGGNNISTSVGATDKVVIDVTGAVLTTSDQSIAGNKTFTGVTTFDDAVGFDQITVTYNSADTEVNFKSDGNKAYLVPTGNITDLNLNMPAVSGNFVLILKQDGTGSRLVTNYKVFDNSGSAASGNATVLFAGGSNPTLTTGANKTDILSFYWDADNEICYGVASLNF